MLKDEIVKKKINKKDQKIKINSTQVNMLKPQLELCDWDNSIKNK